jgi:SSS family solute:Na+ symporter
MSLVLVTYGLAIATIITFGVGALVFARSRHQIKQDDTEFFLTARHSVPLSTIAWSFYSGGVGAS